MVYKIIRTLHNTKNEVEYEVKFGVFRFGLILSNSKEHKRMNKNIPSGLNVCKNAIALVNVLNVKSEEEYAKIMNNFKYEIEKRMNLDEYIKKEAKFLKTMKYKIIQLDKKAI